MDNSSAGSAYSHQTPQQLERLLTQADVSPIEKDKIKQELIGRIVDDLLKSTEILPKSKPGSKSPRRATPPRSRRSRIWGCLVTLIGLGVLLLASLFVYYLMLNH